MLSRVKKRFTITALIMTFIIIQAASAGEYDPWSVSTAAPILKERMQTIPLHPEQVYQKTINTPFLGLLKFYQRFISPMDGDRCPLYPTCSQYSIEAIRRHGPVVGLIMTADRLIHEADERHLSQAAMVGSRMRFLDSLNDNDFWWYKP